MAAPSQPEATSASQSEGGVTVAAPGGAVLAAPTEGNSSVAAPAVAKAASVSEVICRSPRSGGTGCTPTLISVICRSISFIA